MSFWLPEKFEQKKPYLEKRMALIKAVRRFFDDKTFWEVETPILQISPTMDTHIHAFKTTQKDTTLKHQRDIYLHTSPEFAMKKLMVAGVPNLYQICHVFRNAEGSNLHLPEFTMIEWYRAHAGYEDIMDDCEGLLRDVARSLDIQEYRYKSHRSNPFKGWNRLSVTEALAQHAKIDLEAVLEDAAAFASAAAEQGVRVIDTDSWEDIFFAVMDALIEPELGMGVPTILYDYPASMASLSRKKPTDERFAERFELYVCGIELANAFGELTDAAEQRKRFEADMALKQKLYGHQYPIDEDFMRALEYGLPESSGIALGLDRLTMLATGADDINDVLWTRKP